jgi:hypothetical protein
MIGFEYIDFKVILSNKGMIIVKKILLLEGRGLYSQRFKR